MLLNLLEIQEKRQELMDEIEAIKSIAESEKRDITEDEAKQIDANLDKDEELQKDQVRAEKIDAVKKGLAAKRGDETPAPIKSGFDPPPEKPVIVPKSHVPLKHFKNDKEAYDAGMFLIAALAPADPQFHFADKKAEAIQYCRDNGLILADAQTSDDAGKGGYLAPAPLSNTIIRIVTEVGIAPRIADVVPMSSETLDMSKRSSGLTVYAPAEASAITTSEMQWTRVSLSVTDRATLTRISLKLLRSAITSIADRVAEEIAYAAANQMDNELINGDGTSTYFGETGLVSAIGSAGVETGASGVDTWPELLLLNHHNAMSFLPSRFWRNPVWICSPAYYNAVMIRLAAAAGGNTIQNVEGGANRPSFLGYPVLFTDHMPTTTAVSQVSALFGSFNNAVMLGNRQGVSIGTSTERYFDSGEIAIRGMWAYDINVHEPGDSSNAGAYTAVKTAAS